MAGVLLGNMTPCLLMRMEETAGKMRSCYNIHTQIVRKAELECLWLAFPAEMLGFFIAVALILKN